MNTDSINNEDKLSEALKKLLDGIMKSFNDPLMKVRENSLYMPVSIKITLCLNVQYSPSKRGYIKELKEIAKTIRNIGREKILERIKAFKNNEHVPDDILSNILKSYSMMN